MKDETVYEITQVTDPAVLAEFPLLAPPKDELADIESIGRGRSVSTYRTSPGRPRAGVGRVSRCEVCGTLLRTGQPHSAVEPVPHQALDMLVVIEPLEVE